MQSVDNNEMRKSSSRSKKLKNLEAEVDIILSQDKADEDNKLGVYEMSPKSSKTYRPKVFATPKSSRDVLQEYLQTPRRSCRRSVKPTQDYDDIVNKSTRSARKHMITGQDEENQRSKVVSPRWTPAKVGRVSNKRTRKSRRTGNPKKQNDGETNKEAEKTECKQENIDAVDVTKDQKKGENLFEKILEQNEQPDEIINETLEPILVNENIQVKDIFKANSEPVVEVIKQKQVDEIVDNMGHLNVKTECNNIQNEKEENKQVEREGDNENDDFKDHNDSFHLVQDDSEDSQDFKEKAEKDFCIVYENNISNGENRKDNDFGENVQDKFGCYLKSKDINISDLGLNPIKDEQEEVNEVMTNQLKLPSHETEEMPSLEICDDEEVNATQCITLNETFDASDSVILIEDVKQNCTKSNEEIMETLQVSDDDGETPRKCPRIVLTDTQLKDQVILCSPKGSEDNKAKLPSTPKTSLKISSTKKSTKYRFPTPYRNKQGNIVKKTPIKIPFNSSTISVTTMEPKEIVLRGIRKRSLSVCIEGNEQKSRKLMTGSLAKAKHDRVVSFHSPANQTTIIDDLDVKISKKLKNQNPQEKETFNKFVTTRRKRSMSFDESMSTLVSKLPRPVVGQKVLNKIQTSTSKPQLRTKLPNFAAIHQKQFEKMENLEEHVNRKQERSNNLINSVTKLRPVSAQKGTSIAKSSNNISSEKPKALKKIDLENISQIKKFNFNATVTEADLCRSQKIHEDKKIINLPDRRLVASKVPTSNRPLSQQQNYKYLKTSQITNIENPRANTKTLSTSLMVKPTKSSSSFVKNANTSHMSYSDKMASRLQRHMDLFKGRGPSSRSVTSSSKNEILRGVRSNRRFELQMQHRKNLEN